MQELTRVPALFHPPRPLDERPLGPVGFRVVALAASAGGLEPLRKILAALPPTLNSSILVVRHLPAGIPSYTARVLQRSCPLPVKWACDGDFLEPGTVFVVPGDCHLTFSRWERLVVRPGPRINFVRPSADVLFESMAEVFGDRALAVVLSGIGTDGALGTRAIRRAGGFVMAEDSATAGYVAMPESAADLGNVDLILTASQIGFAIAALTAEHRRFLGDTIDSAIPPIEFRTPLSRC